MPPLTKNALPLLRIAGGMRHATDDHHDKPVHRTKSSARGKRKMETEDDINAEPQSSDNDDLHVPAPRLPKSKLPTPEPVPDPELNHPKRRSGRKKTEIRSPALGAFKKGRADKAKKANEHDKENATSSQLKIDYPKDSVYGFYNDELTTPLPKKQKQTYGANKTPVLPVKNIHAPPPKKSAPVSSRIKPAAKKKVYTRKAQEVPQNEEDDDDLDNVSMLGLSDVEPEKTTDTTPKQGEDPELRTKKPRRRSLRVESLIQPTALNEDELKKILGEQPKPWQHDRSLSSQPNSTAPTEALNDINEYQFQLPPEEEEGSRCDLCREIIEIDDYWEFWKGKKRTHETLTAFCNIHKKKSAQKEYDDERFPPIDWDALSERILKHRMKLFKILNGTSPSKHRNVYEPLALTGKAATTVPSRRKDLPAALQEELNCYNIDDQSTTFPGYYGPRGRRVITESVTEIFANEIKNCKDPVVQASGPAAFVQAVMVPETAVLLIMEDCQVDKDAAEEIRERTYDMGVLLNEEVEDEVELQDGDESEDENEYHAA